MALDYNVTKRRQYVTKLRTAGASLDQCADQAIQHFGAENLPKNYNGAYVWRDIQAVQKRIYKSLRTTLDTFRLIQLDRYEHVIKAHWVKAMAGHQGATDRVLKAMKDENKLLGLDAPERMDVRVAHIDARIEQLMERLASPGEGQTSRALGTGRREPQDAIVEGTVRYR